MRSTVCEICRFHPATRQVTVVDDGERRAIAVCDVHRRIAVANAAWIGSSSSERNVPRGIAD